MIEPDGVTVEELPAEEVAETEGGSTSLPGASAIAEALIAILLVGASR